MEKVKLQNEMIPPIALGTWSWGTGQGGGDAIFGNHLTAEDLKPVFDAAMKAGLHLWDTATVYGMGASESILGEFTKGRDDVLLSTKFTPQLGGPVEDRLNSSLNRLGADQTDIYWIHNPLDVKRWTPELIPLMKSGKVKYAGVSNHTLKEIQLAQSILAEEGLNISAVQNHYSLLYRSSEEAGIIDYCNENNIVFFSYMVLEQGALTDKYNAKNPLPSGTRRGAAFDEDVLAKLEGLIHVMKEVGNHHNANSAQVAIAWAIAKGTVPIIGVTRTSQIADAVKAAEITLTAEEILDLETAAKETGIVIKGEWEKPMH
ncbi:aldo/keto reductase [Paenibacillus favisporus]|uniref:aldo/keto reductase n=1 Tax=Paenibacillus favisporus TaxID=221028 RepID=UPI002DBE9E4A|nr:aldo/keto reductase [Paenibacillus favisporus]MEC0179725.1 aldo/keto reductase [Paenibacillus favisporus]